MRRGTYLFAWSVLLSFASFMVFMSPVYSRRFRSSVQVLGVRTGLTNCRIQRSFPDPKCTPGDVVANLTAADICRPDFPPSAEVSVALADQIYYRYGIPSYLSGGYHIDRFIGASLGGSDNPANLWPQAEEPRPGFYEKNRVENYLHSEVCSGRISLETARRMIVSDWLQVFLVMPL